MKRDDRGLELKSLNVGYDDDVIKDITLQVSPGKIVTIIGPNGAGKSTLLKTVTGRLKKRSGTILVGDEKWDDLSAKDAARHISMVMTTQVRPELMTCREVVESGRYPYTGMFGRLSDEDHKKVEEAISVTETKEIEDRLFSNISDGQRQRVLLARSIAQEPDILVLDEPTAYLDIKYRIDILTKIKQHVMTNNTAVLMSLHEPETAMRISDVVVAVGGGIVQRIGSPSEVFTESFIRKLYGLGDMSMELLGSLPYISKEKAAGDRPKAQFSKGVIMVMGTMSNVGKSLIAAGLCRVFTQDGYSVAPFKSQNMANNSYVTDDGLEMGRAQAVQAMCCNTAPAVCMNPVLLKPTDDVGSQVVVMGKSVGNMPAKEYFAYKKELIPVIKEAYEELRRDHDIIVVEGAGSPAEINLRENDIVNMGLAEMINAPVLLVGDIDRGGVFAQLIGTLDLLPESERERVAGLVINKFRGDASLLDEGIRMLEDKAKCPVTGVIDYTDIDIDDEDSLTERFSQSEKKALDIAVIRLPRISNFTDFDALSRLPDVSVRYVDKPGWIGDADMIIIPGTKNTTGDMKWMASSGMADTVRDHAAKGTVIIGICGGYQMLGCSVADPYDTEGGETVQGLGLLAADTVLEKEKVRRQYEGVITDPTGVLGGLGGCAVKGYEIHMGRTSCREEISEFISGGSGYCKDNIYGTYVHGLFDTKEALCGIVGAVAAASGKCVELSVVTDMDDYRNSQYDRLADVIRNSLDLNAIYKVMGYER